MTSPTVFEFLQKIDGYFASALFDKQGILLAHHSNSAYSFNTFGSSISQFINELIQTADEMQWGDFYSIQINYELGILNIIWSDKENIISAILLDNRGNVGLAKLELMKIMSNFITA